VVGPNRPTGTTMTPAQSSNGVVTASGSAIDLEAFRSFPYGLFVTSADGTIVACNLQATRLIEAKGLSPNGLRCCELLGCRTPDTVLSGGCVTEMTLAHGSLLPEMRIDIDADSGQASLWVAAAPLGGTGNGAAASHVVVQLRPGVVNDRRRRTDPHWMSGPRLRIRVLGATIVESPEGPIGGEWLDQRAGQLLKFLVAERHRSVHVEEIGESIWPKADFAVAANVRYYIHALRKLLEPGRGSREPSAFVVSRAGGYRLNLDRVMVDADEFEQHVSSGLEMAEHDALEASTELERGIALYRGDFLADLPYAEWTLGERHRLHDLACIALHKLADMRLERRALDGAARALERLATMQPYDEAVHRQLMELDVMRGQRSGAIRRYEALRSRMRRTFGYDPEFTPSDLSSPAGQPAERGSA
jgi:DNA-binding SARP family transcriptional activator